MRIITATIVAALGFFIKPNPPPRHKLSWPSYSMILFLSDIYECSLERAVRIPEQLCSQLPNQPFAAIRLIELVRVRVVRLNGDCVLSDSNGYDAGASSTICKSRL